MKAENKLNFIIIILLISLFFIGGWGLYSRRYQGSDIYAHYSSFRTDQMGVKVLYESLESLPEFKVERNFRPLYELQNTGQKTVFIIGCEPGLFEYNDNIKELEDFVFSGGRAIISFTPLKNGSKSEYSEKKCPKCKKTPKPEKKEKKEKKKEKEIKKAEPNLNDSGFDLKSFGRELRFPFKVQPVKPVSTPPIDVFSKNCFEVSDKAWKTLYTLRDKPVIIERKYPGGGSMVFCADSYVFSNESLAVNANAELLLYMLGGRKNIVFDETHLGAVKSRNIIWLARKYNLLPFIAALAATLLLFVWRSLLAPYNREEKMEAEISPEKFSNSSLVNMLRVNFPGKSLLKECWNEFNAGRSSKLVSKHKYAALKNIVTETGNSVDIYNKAVNEYKKREGLKDE